MGMPNQNYYIQQQQHMAQYYGGHMSPTHGPNPASPRHIMQYYQPQMGMNHAQGGYYYPQGAQYHGPGQVMMPHMAAGNYPPTSPTASDPRIRPNYPVDNPNAPLLVHARTANGKTIFKPYRKVDVEIEFSDSRWAPERCSWTTTKASSKWYAAPCSW